MRIARPTDLSRTIASLLALAAGTLWSAPAFAQWETAHGYALKTGDKCPAPHSRDPDLRRSDGGTFDIPAGFKGEIEIYGHGVDLIRDISVSGETWASFARGVGGAENAVRGCGAIGSLVIAIDVRNTEPAGTHTLRFGDQTMRVRIVKPSITATVWSEQTRRGSSTLPSGTPPRAPAPPPPPPTQLITSTNNGNGCGPASNSSCTGGGGAMIFPGSGGGAAPFDAPPRLADSIGGCIDELGGSAIFEGTVLTITLPNTRSDRYDIPCLTRPIFFNLVTSAPSDDVGGFRTSVTNQFRQNPGRAVDPPRYSGTLSGFTGPTVLDDPDRDYQSLRMTAELARTFVGERRITLTPAPGSGGANPLTLVLRTVPANGIRDIEGVPLGATRSNSSIDVRFDFLSGDALDTVVWRLRAAGGPNPAACFDAASGSVTSFGGGIGRFTLRAKEAPGCDNARFALDIAPSGASFFGNALLSKTVEFALIPKTTPVLNPGGVNRPQPRPIGN
jgi:hypothetical protein